MKKYQLSIGQKQISIYPSTSPAAPVIYLNSVEDTTYSLPNAPDVSIVVISGLDWNAELSPWPSPSIFKGAPLFCGSADQYLEILLHEIAPKAEALLPHPISWRGLAGYSMAGLFAVYALYQTDFFTRIASVSGSLWFPGIREYVFSQKMKARPDRIYFSLGDREHKTHNAAMRPVKENTEAIEDFYHQAGIRTIFETNPGNHFTDPTERTEKGIAWLLH